MSRNKKRQQVSQTWQPGDQCGKCGSTETVKKPRTFKNGVNHVELSCRKCGKYIKFIGQDEKVLLNNFASTTVDRLPLSAIQKKLDRRRIAQVLHQERKARENRDINARRFSVPAKVPYFATAANGEHSNRPDEDQGWNFHVSTDEQEFVDMVWEEPDEYCFRFGDFLVAIEKRHVTIYDPDPSWRKPSVTIIPHASAGQRDTAPDSAAPQLTPLDNLDLSIESREALRSAGLQTAEAVARYVTLHPNRELATAEVKAAVETWLLHAA